MEIKKVSEAKRRANTKWNKENIANIACSVRKTEAAAFKAYAAAQGKSASGLLLEFVRKCINSDKAE